MKSNFDFLEKDMDTIELLEPAKKIERLYGSGEYAIMLFEIRKVVEFIAKNIVDFAFLELPEKATFSDYLREAKRNHLIDDKQVLDNFYNLKNLGNESAHTMNIEYSKETGLINLEKFYRILVWYTTKYTEVNVKAKPFYEPQPIVNYQSFERKLIYIQTLDGSSKDWPIYANSEKIGDASINDPEVDARPNSKDLRSAAEKRINQYMSTAGVPHKLEWAELAYRRSDGSFFRDHDVHEVLERSGVKRNPKLAGREWYLTDLETAKLAIKAVKDGKKYLDNNTNTLSKEEKTKIELRPEQKNAVLVTRKGFKKYDVMLWNAKMRFGKTLTALELVKEENFKRVLIITHRPVVSDSWFDDFSKIGMKEAGYVYGSRTEGEPISSLESYDGAFVYFASIQDLRGSYTFGGTVSDKNREFTRINWDLIIIDEAHEGTQTPLAQRVIAGIKNNDTKILELSGTPFNLMDKYTDEQIYTWDYVMEQEAKYKWNREEKEKPNPYESLPKVSMYTFDISEQFKKEHYTNLIDKSFNFKEFFRTDDSGNFVHEEDVMQFLNNITTPNDKNNYPFSTIKFRDNLRHTLWLLPGVKEANALEKLMKKHPVFGMDYNIVNIVRNDSNDSVEEAKESDLQMVRDAIGSSSSKTKTITLTVRKLTTGVNVPEWTGVVFLSNTNSATQYLQAAFRAQTPFVDEKLGRKTECFIFDFAPDRALTVMAESSCLNTGVGKITSDAQRVQMNKLLNFLPIIGKENNVMKRFSVDSLLTKIKRVYAEKAVRSGFEDDSLYSDELLKLDKADLTDFNNLKALVGTTKKEKSPINININNQGLSDEEYEESERGRKKKPKDRTPEEIEAMEKLKEIKKQRKTMISILRSISIRIPLMVYGMDIPITEDISIKKFVNLVDDVSWKEFMPEGVTKELFLRFSKYYDSQVFIEAGRIIRQRVKKVDTEDPIIRARELVLIFDTFRNPDKETVLTPWRVVNMQLGKTVGGLSFYDSSYKDMTVNGKDASHWIDTEYTRQVFNPNAHILEINSKTGLYPLYAAISLYYQEFSDMNEQTAGKFTLEDELFIWQRILRENIFVIAKTPMAKMITQRTLVGYKDFSSNIEYVENIVSDSKKNIKDEANKIRKRFNNMKFDVVIGNPPYQEVVAKKETNNGQKRVNNIFQNFQLLADELADKYTDLIYPGGRWIHRSGKGMNKFGLNQINDPKLKQLIYFPDANEVFSHVDIGDGLSIVVKDMSKKEKRFRYSYIKGGEETSKDVGLPGTDLLVLNPLDDDIVQLVDKFVAKNKLGYICDSETINQKLFRIESDFAERNPDKVKLFEEGMDIDYTKSIKLFTNDKAGKMGRATWFVADKDVITVNQEILNKWKVIVSSANAGGQKRDNQIEVIDNHSAFGRSRIALKAFDTKIEAENFYKYANSYIIRYTFLLTDESLSSLGKKTPDILNYNGDNTFIDFDEDIDEQLKAIIGMSDEQFEYVKNRVDNIRK